MRLWVCLGAAVLVAQAGAAEAQSLQEPSSTSRRMQAGNAADISQNVEAMFARWNLGTASKAPTSQQKRPGSDNSDDGASYAVGESLRGDMAALNAANSSASQGKQPTDLASRQRRAAEVEQVLLQLLTQQQQRMMAGSRPPAAPGDNTRSDNVPPPIDRTAGIDPGQQQTTTTRSGRTANAVPNAPSTGITGNTSTQVALDTLRQVTDQQQNQSGKSDTAPLRPVDPSAMLQPLQGKSPSAGSGDGASPSVINGLRENMAALNAANGGNIEGKQPRDLADLEPPSQIDPSAGVDPAGQSPSRGITGNAPGQTGGSSLPDRTAGIDLGPGQTRVELVTSILRQLGNQTNDKFPVASDRQGNGASGLSNWTAGFIDVAKSPDARNAGPQRDPAGQSMSGEQRLAGLPGMLRVSVANGLLTEDEALAFFSGASEPSPGELPSQQQLNPEQLVQIFQRTAQIVNAANAMQASTAGAKLAAQVSTMLQQGLTQTGTDFASQQQIADAANPWADYTYYSAGQVTPIAPTQALNGAAEGVYNGRVLGAFGSGEVVSGTMTMNITFGSGEMDGGITFAGGNGTIGLLGSVSGTGITGNVDLGSNTAFGGTVAGTLNGSMFGPRAEEVGGNWNLSVSGGARDGQSAAGAFAGKQ